MAPRFLLRTLGALELQPRDGGKPLLANHRKRLALLAALDAREFASREWIQSLLWPESDAERARNALNQLVFGVRREVGDDWVVGDATVLRLNYDVIESDLRTFRGAVAAGRLAEAIEGYRGPFLDGVYLRDAPEFERFVEDTRRSLAEDYGRTLERGIAAALEARQYDDALRWGGSLAVHDPLSTRRALILMRAFEASGDIAAAVRHGTIHEARVIAELQAPPEASLQGEMSRLRATAVSATMKHNGADAPDIEERPHAEMRAPAPSVAPAAGTPRAENASRPFRLRAIAAVTLTLILAVGTTATAVMRPRRDVVVIESFDAPPGDPALGLLNETISRSVISVLERSQRLVIVAAGGENASSKGSMGNADAGCLLRFLTIRCRAGFVVAGKIRRVGDSVDVMSAIVVRGSRAQQRSLLPISRHRADLAPLARDAADVISGAVASLADTRLPELAASAQLPNYDAYIAYARGVEFLAAADVAEALKNLALAAGFDTSFTAPRILLLKHADPASRQAESTWLAAHRARLSRRDQGLVDAIEAEHQGSYPEWYRLSEQLRSIEPRDPLVLSEFAEAAWSQNYFAASDSALEQLKQMPGWEADDPNVQYLQLGARHQAGDFEGALRFWRGMSQRARSDDVNICTHGVLQYAAAGRARAVDSLIAQCSVARDLPGDLGRLGRRVTIQDELYRRAGREFLWHGYTAAGRQALDRAFQLERQLYTRDSSAVNGWIAKELSRDWRAAYDLLLADFGSTDVSSSPCRPRDPRRACFPRNRLRFGVTAAHVGDTATALAVLRWLDAQPHEDSVYKVDRAKLLLALGRKDDALRWLRNALSSVRPGNFMHANTELMELRGDPVFEALIAPRSR